MPVPHHSVVFEARCFSWRPANSVKELRAIISLLMNIHRTFVGCRPCHMKQLIGYCADLPTGSRENLELVCIIIPTGLHNSRPKSRRLFCWRLWDKLGHWVSRSVVWCSVTVEVCTVVMLLSWWCELLKNIHGGTINHATDNCELNKVPPTHTFA